MLVTRVRLPACAFPNRQRWLQQIDFVTLVFCSRRCGAFSVAPPLSSLRLGPHCCNIASSPASPPQALARKVGWRWGKLCAACQMVHAKTNAASCALWLRPFASANRIVDVNWADFPVQCVLRLCQNIEGEFSRLFSLAGRAPAQ